MDTSNIKIELVNFDLGYSSPPRLVQGYSGKSYGLARFSQKYNAHMLSLTVEEYNKAAKDLSKAWHQTLRRWVPMFVVEEAAEAPKRPSGVPIVSCPPPSTVSVTGTIQTPADPKKPAEPVEIPEDLSGMKYFGLVSLAKRLEIDPDQFKGDKPGLIQAIQEKQLQPA